MSKRTMTHKRHRRLNYLWAVIIKTFSSSRGAVIRKEPLLLILVDAEDHIFIHYKWLLQTT
jgi:hypothetical protein